MAMDQQRRIGSQWGLLAGSGYCGHRLTPRAGEPIWVIEASLVDPVDVGQGTVDACVEIGTRDLLLGSLSAERPCLKLQSPVLLDEEFCFYVERQGDDTDSDSDADADTDSDTDTDTDDTVAVYFRGVMLPLVPLDMEEEEEEGEEAVSSDDDDGEESHEHEEESEGQDTEGEEEEDEEAVSSEDDVGEEESEGQDTEDNGDAMSSDNEDTARSDEEDKENDGDLGGTAATASGVGVNVLRRRRNFVHEAEEPSLGVPAPRPRFSVRTGHVDPLVAAGAFLGIFALVYLMRFLILVMYS